MIIFLYGEDTYRSRQKLNELKEKFLKEVDQSGNSVVALPGETLNLKSINEAAATSSLFARKRLLIIERIFKNKSKTIFPQITSYLKTNFNNKSSGGSVKADNENIIIFWDEAIDKKDVKNELYDFLSKQKFSYRFHALSNTETSAWVRKECEIKNVKIKPQAAALLAGMFPANLWQLNNEINKLICYHAGKSNTLGGEPIDIVIDEKDINEMVVGSFNENIFAFTDAVANRNKASALSIFENEISAGISEINLLSMIERQFKILLLVRQCLDKSYTSKKISSLLLLHPFVIQKSLTQARNFTINGIKKILDSLLEIDQGIKSGKIEAKSALSLLFVKF